MAKEKSVKLTKFELEVMDALWDAGSASVREIHERLPEKKRVAYTTVQTIVYRLEEKGAVWRSKKIGNAHIFEPLITRKSVHRRLIDDLVDLLGGSARPLMAHLIESGRLTLDGVRELEQTLTAIEREAAAQPRKQSRKNPQKKEGDNL